VNQYLATVGKAIDFHTRLASLKFPTCK